MMNNLSLIQEYFICALPLQGSTNLSSSSKKNLCLLAAGLMELCMDGYLSINEKKRVVIERELTNDKAYMQAIYDAIGKKQESKVESIASAFAFSEKYARALFAAVGLAAVQADAADMESRVGFFKNKTRFIPRETAVTRVVESLRAEFLEDGHISEETAVLGALLHKSDLLKHYFSKYEEKKLRNRLDEIKQSEAGRLAKQMIDYIDALLVVIIMSASST